VASQNLGHLGPRDGPAVQVNCPLGDSLRSVAGWFVVVLLLALRQANRRKEAWALLVPLGVLYLALAVAERQLNAYLIFHIHQYICSSAAELLRYFALSLAMLLAIADRLDIPWRPVRFVLVFLLLLLCAEVQIVLNAWPILDAGIWARVFGVVLLLFVVGRSLLYAVLRRLVNPARFGWWYGGLCLAFGLLPMLALGAAEAYFSRAPQLQSTQEQFRVVVVFTSALSLLYLVFFPFLVLALRSPLYRDRLAHSFGVSSLAPAPAVKAESLQFELLGPNTSTTEGPR
jgi:hypothetical protein